MPSRPGVTMMREVMTHPDRCAALTSAVFCKPGARRAPRSGPAPAGWRHRDSCRAGHRPGRGARRCFGRGASWLGLGNYGSTDASWPANVFGPVLREPAHRILEVASVEITARGDGTQTTAPVEKLRAQRAQRNASSLAVQTCDRDELLCKRH